MASTSLALAANLLLLTSSGPEEGNGGIAPAAPGLTLIGEEGLLRRGAGATSRTAGLAPTSAAASLPPSSFSTISGAAFIDVSAMEETTGDPVHNAAGRMTEEDAKGSGEGKDEEEDAYDSCCICFEGKEFVLTSCCHLFCLPCITRWIEISSTCPICRHEFDIEVELYNLIGAIHPLSLSHAPSSMMALLFLFLHFVFRLPQNERLTIDVSQVR